MDGANARPIIIKRKKVVGGDGHHGGAWKVAYADFVTAMMAFFMLMWLLNATTEKQRKGIADYFSPTIPIVRVSGGGDGSFSGDSVFTEDTLVQNGTGGTMQRPSVQDRSLGDTGEAQQEDGELDPLETVESMLMGRGGESLISDELMEHVVTRLTDEGLIIEIFDLEGEPLFRDRTAEPTDILRGIAAGLQSAFAIVGNEVAIAGHLSRLPIVVRNNPVWDLSTSRADAMRGLLTDYGLSPNRTRRVTGYADREPVVTDATDPRNNRLEVVLLREGK